MRLLLDQLEQSLETGNYYLSLFTALTIPDIAGAMDSEDGLASGARYKAWYEAWVRPRINDTAKAAVPAEFRGEIPAIENPFDGEACWLFRCSLLHQGKMAHPKSPYSRIVFIEPGATSNRVHFSISGDILCIDLVWFCQEMILGARMWLDRAEVSDLYQRNFNNFIQRHPDGVPPIIGGVPVIG